MRLWLCLALAACGSSGASSQPAAPVTSGSDASMIDAPAEFPDTLGGQRDRLLATYHAYLEAHADTTMTNGLRGSDLLHRYRLTEDFLGRCLKP